MKKLYAASSALLIILSAMIMMSFVLSADVSAKIRFDSLPAKFITKTERNSYLKNGFKTTLPVLKPVQNQTVAPKQSSAKADNEKLLSDVVIFPNPITDKINVSYSIKRNTNVSIKIMDVLGNDVLTLMSQRVEAGDQKSSFLLSNRISPGFYFVRIIVGTEPFIKRISIL
ncbi:MAG: T9SS type A sorting domain-containing protein [Sphingobacteriaceae bacterium]|nr:MAG: T9SS type A sorting domain-containing protein [Sphingobacteriaceae bacterium]